MATRLPFQTNTLYRDTFIYNIYASNLVYRHNDLSPFRAVPDDWIPSPTTAFTIGNDYRLSVLEAGSLTWDGISLDDYANCCIAIKVEIDGRTGSNLTIEVASDSSVDESVQLILDTESNLVTLGTLSDSSNTLLSSRSLPEDKAYLLELWIFNDTCWGILNNAILLSYQPGASVLAALTHPVISIAENSDGTFPTIRMIEMKELVATPDPNGVPAGNLYLQARINLMDKTSNTVYEDWGAYKDAYTSWRKLRGRHRFSDRQWNRVFGYPVREPATELWLKPE